MEDLREIMLDRRAAHQPTPAIVSGGDCGFCCLAGLVGVSVADAYKVTRMDKALTWYDLRTALQELEREGYLDRAVSSTPIWPIREALTMWGNTSWSMSLEWFDYIRMAVDAGYYAITSINYSAHGPAVQTDHVVMICGARTYKVRINEHGKRYVNEILVSCSARHPQGEWFEVNQFLRKYGGYNVQLARPA